MATQLVFSVIGDVSEELRKLLDEFGQIRNVDIKVDKMAWEGAWSKLLSYALLGNSPDVSHVGSTWASSLVGMNTIRGFTVDEVKAMGGQEIFAAPAWQSATIPGDNRVWSIPWASFTFLVYYRRDHLKKAGISEDHAFDTAEDFIATIKKLKESGIASPLTLPSGKPFLDRVHIAASWMWGAGGSYFSDDGEQILFNSHESRAGLRSFFELYRLMSPKDYQLDYDQTLARFAEGKTSVIIGDCGFPNLMRQQDPDMFVQTGVHPLPGKPFVSGDNLIIWKDVRQSLERERAALDLVTFLVSETAQKRFSQPMEQFPVRHDAIKSLNSPIEQMIPVLQETFEHGRAHKPGRLWARAEQQLGHAFDDITTDVINKAMLPVESILEIHLPQLRHTFSLLMK